MASPREVKQVVYPDGMRPLSPSRSSLSDVDDAETMTGGKRGIEDDAISVLSMVSFPDPAGRKGFGTAPDDEPEKAVYEAWEIIVGRDTLHWDTWKTICGINLGVKWKALDDGFIDVNPLPGYSQGELADLQKDAVREYEAKNSKKPRSYAQDLANRVFRLEAGVYNRIQHLIDNKIRVTNRTPFRRREWRIVILEEGEFQMTELLPERKKGLFRRRPEKAAVHRWFLVIRGEEIKTSKEDGGWRLFSRHHNPWWRIDLRETQEARKEHRDHFEKVNRNPSMRRGPMIRNVPRC
ncbi:hypothetical protein F4677DRAFT_71993 [Hypoxylon crocopeplum]|nr:hypothetical protein F4677DRAFT_71993 [Hypoxylon crocopeplum]